MSTVAIDPPSQHLRPVPKIFTSWEKWGLLLVVPYLLIFLVFVIYPVGYGLWLARHPDSYQRLFADPIFFRTVINTVVFVVVAVNIKMLLAMGLSGFFLNTRWWVKILSVVFILPWAVPSIPTILSMRFTGAKGVLRYGEQKQVDGDVHGGVDVPAQLGTSAPGRDAFYFFRR